MGKAKCEAQLNNATGEAAALLEAAEWFLRAEENLVLTSSFSIRENLDFFVSCSLKAARIYEMNDHLTFAASVYIHVGDTLMPPPSLKHDSEQVGAYSLKAYLTDGQVPSEACAAGLLDSDLFLLLKSLIMAYKSSNITELEYTATYLQSHTTAPGPASSLFYSVMTAGSGK
ncbi:unnamed protein product [Schistocephalus solidus]|uniref:Uncharacterized protein n=1 Tax=Schistocephalus solidus TaxID=70667 RepID=A0A3P7E6Q7_SCHSO|nr:unnamed protein product [Schistocephalus solidus]